MWVFVFFCGCGGWGAKRAGLFVFCCGCGGWGVGKGKVPAASGGFFFVGVVGGEGEGRFQRRRGGGSPWGGAPGEEIALGKRSRRFFGERRR